MALRALGNDHLFQGGIILAQRGQDRMTAVDDLGHKKILSLVTKCNLGIKGTP
jgi:hypothetical protein